MSTAGFRVGDLLWTLLLSLTALLVGVAALRVVLRAAPAAPGVVVGVVGGILCALVAAAAGVHWFRRLPRWTGIPTLLLADAVFVLVLLRSLSTAPAWQGPALLFLVLALAHCGAALALAKIIDHARGSERY